MLAGKGGENVMRRPLKKVILTFYKNGCPKRYEENDQRVENWNGGEISFHFFSWHGNHKGVYPPHIGDDPVQMSRIQRDRTSPEKVEAYFDEKERLAAVIIDGNKAYDRLDPAFTSCRTELVIDSKECGSELTVLLKHDFIYQN